MRLSVGRLFLFLFLFLFYNFPFYVSAAIDSGPGGSSQEAESSRIVMWRERVAEAERRVQERRDLVHQAREAMDNAVRTRSGPDNPDLPVLRDAIRAAEDRLETAEARLDSVTSNLDQAIASHQQELREAARDRALQDPHGKRPAEADDGKSESKFLKRTLPQPDDGWRLSRDGKIHKRHSHTFTFIALVYYCLWRLLDQLSEAEGDTSPVRVKLASLVKLEDIKEKPASPHQLIEIALREIYEVGHDLYMRHEGGPQLAELFSGDTYFRTEGSQSMKERIDTAKKKFSKQRQTGSGRSGSQQDRRRIGQQPQQPRNRPYQPPMLQYQPPLPPGIGRVGAGGQLVGPCNKCGHMGHLAQNCPNDRRHGGPAKR